ncbi:MAG TPA: PhzF family phenazine biosynthesis isomerase [Jatrophihabitans sp.]|nr:PhzF family phenazine biosynthesis isomerase [Jatrophihabitans sp.]
MRQYAIADAFTDRPLHGNPVAVFLDADGLSGEQMQRIAREMNLSETTFVLPPENGNDHRLRIFTPVNELAFAGHPMLGTVFVLGEQTGAERMVIETAMGPVPIEFERDADGRNVVARMLQPVPAWQPYEHAEALLAALGVDESIVSVEEYRNGPRHVFVGLPDLAALDAVTPDLRAMGRLLDMSGICFAGGGARWSIRMFSPAYGVNEDAATGSAAGPLAIHLARHGLVGWGERIEISQGVQIGRPSTMYARISRRGERIERVEVSGSAVVIGRGSLNV